MPGSTLGLGVRLSATDSMSGPVRSASRSLGMLDDQARSTQQALGALQLRAGAVATGIGVGLTAAIGASVAQAAELEDIMLTIQQKTGFAVATIREMSDDFLKLSAALPLSAQELARVGVIAGQLGIQTKEGIEALAFQASQLARASDLTEETGAAALARLSKLFDLPIEQANRLGSSMVKLANTTTATASSIFEITKRFAGMARVVEINAAQANAFAATLIDAGVSSEVGGTAMTKILASATTKTREFARQIGVSEAQFKQMFSEDATGTLQRFFASFKGMDRYQVQERLKKLGLSGVRVQQAVFGLAAQTKALERNLKSSSRAFSEGTAMQEAFAAQTRSLNAKIDTFMGSLKNVAIAIGNTLIPVIKGVVDAGTALLSVFLSLPQPVRFVVAAVAALAGAFFLLTGVGLLFSGMVSMLSVSMIKYAEAAGITVTSNSVLGLTWTVMSAQLKGLVTGILSGTAALWSQLVALRANAVAWLASIGGVSGLIAATGGWIASAYASVVASIVAAGGFAGLGAAAVAAGVAIWTALAPLLPVILLIVAALGILIIAWKVLKPVIGAIFGAVVALLKPIFVAMEMVRRAEAEVVSAFLSIFDPIADLLQAMGKFKVVFGIVFLPIIVAALALVGVLKVVAFVFRLIARVVGFFVRTVIGVVKGILGGVIDAFRGMIDTFKSAWESLKEAIGTIIEPLVEAWKAIVAAFGGGSGEGASFLAVLGAIAKAVIKGLLFPLRVLAFVLKAVFFVVGLAVKVLVVPIKILARVIGFVVRVLVGFFGAILKAGLAVLRVVFAPLIAVFRVIGAIVSWLKDLFFGSSFLHLIEGLSPVLSVFKVFGKLIRALAAPFKLVAKVVSVVFGLVRKLIGIFRSLFDLVKGVGSVLLAPVKALASAVGGVLSLGKKVVQGVYDMAAGVVGTVVDLGKSVVSTVGNAISSVAEGVGDVVGAVGGAISSGISAIGSFLGLAEGGIVTRPTVAVIGEAGPEAVVPLGRSAGLVAAPTAALAAGRREPGSRGAGRRTVEVSRVVIPITLECDGQVLARIVKEVAVEELLRGFGEPRLRFAGVCT